MTTPIHLETQVGGHDGVLSSADGSVVIKPCLPLEIEFYTTLSSNDAFAHLLPFVPKFYGTLKLHGKMDEQGNIGAADGNLTHTFLKPNVLDVKLGTVLWDEEASSEKRARMERTARETTSLQTGIRLTGFNVYDLTEGKPINTPKSYGKSIKAEDLPSGIGNFFPLSLSDVPRGRGLPKDLLQPVLQGILAEVKGIREAVQCTEMRMVGGSILVVYEADWDALRDSLQSWSQDFPPDEDEADDVERSSDIAEDSDDAKRGPPYLVKLIDFAHTRLRKGEGPDVGVLLGLDTMITLLTNRLAEIPRQEG